MHNEIGDRNMTIDELSNSDPDDSLDEVKARAERLRSAVKNAGGNTQVAARAGMPFGTLNRYIAGRDMKASAMVALAKACGVSLEWLADGNEVAPGGHSLQLVVSAPTRVGNVPTFASDVVTEQRTGSQDEVPIKFFSAEPSAGIGTLPHEWEDGELFYVPRYFISAVLGAWSKNLFFVRVQGDSMQPSINAGDTILVDYTPAPFVQSVYVVSVQGLLMVKRLSIKDPETLSVVSDNPRYSSFDVPIRRMTWATADDNAQLRIIGRVVGRFHLNI
jgi:phage repressor protein C with HTH and peptisase S24 domain